MIRKTDDFTPMPNLRGGEGTVEMHIILNAAEREGHMTMCNRVVLPPHSSIGYHTHETNVEYYYILQGKGQFQNAQGEIEEAIPGDLCLIEKGQSHGMINPYEETLEILAMIFE